MSRNKKEADVIEASATAPETEPATGDVLSDAPVVPMSQPVEPLPPTPPAPAIPAIPEPLPATPEEIARMAGMKGKILCSASRNVVLKRGEAAVHAIFFVTASGEKYRVIDRVAVCLKGYGTKS